MIRFSFFSLKPYVVTPHLNRLIETVQMRGSQHMFLCRINKNYHQLSSNNPSYIELCHIDLYSWLTQFYSENRMFLESTVLISICMWIYLFELYIILSKHSEIDLIETLCQTLHLCTILREGFRH